MNWKEWLEREFKKIDMKEVGLESTTPWQLNGGVIEREDKEYFSVRGYACEKQGFSWTQVLLKPCESEYGFLIMVVAEEEDETYFLLNAKADPGFQGTKLAPSFQASKSKLRANPGYPRQEIIEKSHSCHVWQDGGVHFNKVNNVGISIYHSRKDFEDQFGVISQNERWFTKKELQSAIEAKEVTDHLLQTIAFYYVMF